MLVAPLVVARFPWHNPIDERRARDYVRSWWKSSPLLESPEALTNLAQRAGDMVHARLLSHDRYVDLYWSTEAFHEAGMAALKLCLVDDRHVPAQVDLMDYRRQLEFDLRDAIARVIHSSELYDENDDGAIQDEEKTPIVEGRFIL